MAGGRRQEAGPAGSSCPKPRAPAGSSRQPAPTSVRRRQAAGCELLASRQPRPQHPQAAAAAPAAPPAATHRSLLGANAREGVLCQGGQLSAQRLAQLAQRPVQPPGGASAQGAPQCAPPPAQVRRARRAGGAACL
jgi:hypothetical protein